MNYFNQLFNHYSNRTYSKRKILIPVFVFGLFLVVFQIWILNRLANLGQQSIEIERLKANLILENQLLENKIDHYSSLQKIKPLAGNLGFTTNYKLESIQAFGN